MSRPSRRAAAQRQRIVDSSDEEDEEVNEEEDESDTYTPAPQTPRRASRRLASLTPAASAAATNRTSRTRRTASSELQPRRGATRPAARARGGRATRRTRVSDTPSEAASEDHSVAASPRPQTPQIRTPTPQVQTPQHATPTPPPQTQQTQRASLTPQAQTSRHATPSVANTPVPLQLSPMRTDIQASPARSARSVKSDAFLGVPGISPMENNRQQSPSPSQPPMMTQDLPPIVVKSRSTALLSQQLSQEPSGPKQRLVITHLVLNNFKSYAGERMVGPFHPSFSSVVGPNGSGKSNVIDSLLFVFGFRASKMRQGKISALIHNSATFPNLDFCEVKVYFQEVLDLPAGGSQVIPDTELVISRRAFKNNSSRYYINGSNSDYTQVTTLLRGRGIDLDHKRFLILQGEVESIAQMKPKAQTEHDDGLLEYLEDIIGTSKYKQPIQESETQAEELNDVCVEKSSRVQHVEKEKNSLEDKKNIALDYIRTENDIALQKCALFQLHIADSDGNIRVTSEMVTQIQAELDTELENHRGSEDKIKKLEKKYKSGAKEIEDIEKQTQAILRETSRADKEGVKLKEKEKFLAQKQKKLQKTIQTSKLQASEAIALIQRHEGDRERFDVEAAELTESLKAGEEELGRIRDSLKEKTQGFSDQIAAKQKSLEPWNEKINEKRSAIAVAQSELDILHERSNASKVALEEAEAKIGTIEEAREAKQAELDACRVERAGLEKEAKKLQAEIQKMAKKEPQLKNSLSGAREKADEARSSMASAQSQGQVLTALMRLKESGRIEGFHGRLGNLGTIDNKYDIAVSTACPALENMVVDSVEVGQQCIEYLRKTNLGRANFICLDKLPKKDLSRINTPENAPRLFDLIKPKSPEFAPAFHSVLQNTLVANNLQQANRIAYGAQRWRVVTLEGQLIDKSGAMTGGGTVASKGRMSSKLPAQMSKDAIQKLEQDRDTLEKAYADFQDELRKLQSDLRDTNERIPELDVTMSKIELEIKSSVQHIADAKQRITELAKEKGASATDKTRVTALEKNIKSLEKEIEQLQTETAEVEEEIQSLQDKIMEVGGIKLRSQKSVVDGIREQLETLSEQISAADLGKTKSEKTKKKAEKTIASAEEELESNEIELEGIREDMKAHEKNARENQEKADEAQAYLETKKDELAAFKEDLDEKLAELNKTRAAEIEMKNKLEEHQKVLAENQKRSRHWQAELGKLQLQNIQDLGGEETDEPHETLPIYTEDELADMDKVNLQSQIAVLEEKIKDINIDLSVLAEYRRRVEEHTARNNDLQDAVVNRDSVKHRLDDLRKRRLDEFMEGFNTISLRLKEMYQMITMGGNAELELVDSLDPFSEGILFSVMPPKKSWKNISNLSGGEKTLSSLALVFALHHYKPTPLYVMDEIDAALDFRNVSIVASYIKERTKNAQFIVISLRNNMFELAARLVGVYKVNHMTKSVTIENQTYLATSS